MWPRQWRPEWCDRERGEPLAPKVQTHEGYEAEHNRTTKRQARKMRCLSILSRNAGLRTGQSKKQCSGVLSREPPPRSGLAPWWDHKNCSGTVPRLLRCRSGHSVSKKKKLEPGGVMTEKVILGTSNQDSFRLKYLMVRSSFSSTSKNAKITNMIASVHMSNPTAKSPKLPSWTTSASLVVTSTCWPTANAESRNWVQLGKHGRWHLRPLRLTWLQRGGRWRTLV